MLVLGRTRTLLPTLPTSVAAVAADDDDAVAVAAVAAVAVSFFAAQQTMTILPEYAGMMMDDLQLHLLRAAQVAVTHNEGHAHVGKMTGGAEGTDPGGGTGTAVAGDVAAADVRTSTPRGPSAV